MNTDGIKRIGSFSKPGRLRQTGGSCPGWCGWVRAFFICVHLCPSVVSFLLLFLFAFPAAHAGTITGTVRAEGKPGTETDVLCSKYDSRQFKFVERVNYAEMHDFVVYIDGPAGAKPAAPAQPAQVVTSRVMQKGAMFSPH